MPNSFGFKTTTSGLPTSNTFGFTTPLILPKRLQVGVDENGAPIHLSAERHYILLEHIKRRLLFANPIRLQQVDKFERIDKDVYGYLRLDGEDKIRDRDNQLGKGIKPTDHKLSLIWAQLDEAMTYLANVLAPDAAMYNARAPEAKQEIAKSFAALMNKQGDYFGHYLAVLKFIFACLKYNFGGITTDWQEIFGNKITSGQGGILEIVNEMVFSGNELEAVDPYNFIYDISCHPTKLNREGEFFCNVDMVSRFKLRRMEEQQHLYNFTKYGETNKRTYRFYKTKPVIRGTNISSMTTDWINVFSMGEGTDVVEDGYERLRYTGWIRPQDFGLPVREKGKYEIWRFTVLNDSLIAFAERLNNAHGMLPVNIGMPNDDEFIWQTKSHAEHLVPYQTFASHQVNIAQRASRKALIGLTVYDESFFPGMTANDEDLAGGKIPGNSKNDPDMDLRKKFLQFNDVPDTSNNMQDVERMDALMQKIMPTDLLRQVASLDRATQYQAAATVQSGNRRNLKIAKVLYIQAMFGCQHQQMYNILQYQQTMDLLTPQGELIRVNPVEFRDAQLEFDIDDGLKGLDKIAMRLEMREILMAIIQSQAAMQQFDVPAIINYYTSLIGDNTDFAQFRIKSLMDALPPQQRDLAYQLLQQFIQQQQAGGAGGEAVGGAAQLAAVT